MLVLYMFLTESIYAQKNNFIDLCRAYKVRKLYAFGSVLTERFDDKSSDIDLLVEINEKDPIKKGGLLLDFFEAMQKFFNRKVDLLTDQPIRNPFLRSEVDKNKVLIYDGERKEILI